MEGKKVYRECIVNIRVLRGRDDRQDSGCR